MPGWVDRIDEVPYEAASFMSFNSPERYVAKIGIILMKCLRNHVGSDEHINWTGEDMLYQAKIAKYV